MSANITELIYDWNTIYAKSMVPAGKVLLNDESLRDGLPANGALEVYPSLRYAGPTQRHIE